MKIPRRIIPESIEKVENYFKTSNILLISGPNGCGKTYIVENFLQHFKDEEVLVLDGINMRHRIILMNNDHQEFARLIRGKSIVFIDSAQRVPNTEEVLQNFSNIDRNIKIVVAYSTREIEEKNQIRVYPISFSSLKTLYPSTPSKEIISEMMIYGCLPKVLLANTVSEKLRYLDNITNIDIMRDLFELENITNSKALIDLLCYIALNINISLSINEISKQINMNPRTTRRYLNILEKHYIIHEHTPYKANISTQKTMFSRYYFYDLGIRNCLIQNFAPLNYRNDFEQLWANFVIMERHKAGELSNKSHSQDYESYFWETYSGIGIDLVEINFKHKLGEKPCFDPNSENSKLKSDDQEISLFRFGFSDKRRINALAPEIFTKKYQNASYQVITLENFEEFVRIEL